MPKYFTLQSVLNQVPNALSIYQIQLLHPNNICKEFLSFRASLYTLRMDVNCIQRFVSCCCLFAPPCMLVTAACFCVSLYRYYSQLQVPLYLIYSTDLFQLFRRLCIGLKVSEHVKVYPMVSSFLFVLLKFFKDAFSCNIFLSVMF